MSKKASALTKQQILRNLSDTETYLAKLTEQLEAAKEMVRQCYLGVFYIMHTKTRKEKP